MRIIMIVLTLIFIFLSNITHGLDIKIPKRTLYLHVDGKYSDRWIRVFKEKNKWICQTESMPYVELIENPIKNFEKYKFDQKELQIEDCRDLVKIKNNLSGVEKHYSGCLSENSINELFKDLNKSCRIY